MKPFVIKPILRLCTRLSFIGDKSIAHRLIIIGSISRGEILIKNFPINDDCFSTIGVFRKLGIKIRILSSTPYNCTLSLSGRGLKGLQRPKGHLFVGDSGTTLRLLLGVLAGQSFKANIRAGKGLSKRPMLRVTSPLRIMGASIRARTILKDDGRREEYAPLTIKGGNLRPVSYKLPVSSAQVKSAILLAALNTKGLTVVTEKEKTRDHTERILKLFKADLKIKGRRILLKGNKELSSPRAISVPGDISSAAFFMVLGCLIPGAELILENISLNPTRMGIIKVLKRMHANISIKRDRSAVSLSEPVGSVIVKGSPLKGTRIRRQEVPFLIDELPILMVAASYAKGKTYLEGVEELRIKETDRINSMIDNLTRMKAKIKLIEAKNGSESMLITGVKHLKGARVRSFSDHRTAMSVIIAALAARGNTIIDEISCINKSFPNFISILESLRR